MREIEKLPKVSGSGATQAHLSDAASQMLENAFKEASNFKDDYVSTEHLLLGMTKLKRDPAKEILAQGGRDLRQHSARLDRGARQSEGHRPESRGEVPGAGTLCQGPDGAGAARQARSGDRPRRGSASRDAGAVAPDEEQSGAHRRAGRRQDRHRGRAGAAHRFRRRSRAAARTSASCRSTWARCWRARSIAASSKTA